MDISPARLRRSKELKAFRNGVGVTQVALSIASGLTRTTIVAIEKGTIGWNVDSELLYFETLKQWQR